MVSSYSYVWSIRIFFILMLLSHTLKGEPIDYETLTHDGMNMNPPELALLEKKFSKDSSDLSDRAKLLVYYWLYQSKEKKYISKHQEQVMWIIDHIPQSPLAGMVSMSLDNPEDASVYQKVKKKWLVLVEDTKNITLLRNAAYFFRLQDTELGIKLLKRVAKLEPENYYWVDIIGDFYSTMMQREENASVQRTLVQKALRYKKDAYAMTTSEQKQFYMLSDLVDLSWRTKELNASTKYAKELLTMASRYPKDWNYGNAIFTANHTLGLIALYRNDIVGAKKYLLKAGQTPGSPQLGSYGPSMVLAKELLDRGEKEIVLQYLRLCEKFWSYDREKKLETWISEIEKGSVPDFGWHLKR